MGGGYRPHLAIRSEFGALTPNFVVLGEQNEQLTGNKPRRMGLLKRAIRKEEEEGDEDLVAKLIECASEGDAQGIRDLAARGVDLDARGNGEHMQNALMVASMHGLEVRRSV